MMTWEGVMKVDTVLVPLDGSPLAEMALSTAIDLLRDSPDATLILLRAAEATTLPGVDPTDAQVGVVREAEEYLEVVAARARDEGVSGHHVGVVQPARRGDRGGRTCTGRRLDRDEHPWP